MKCILDFFKPNCFCNITLQEIGRDNRKGLSRYYGMHNIICYSKKCWRFWNSLINIVRHHDGIAQSLCIDVRNLSTKNLKLKKSFWKWNNNLSFAWSSSQRGHFCIYIYSVAQVWINLKEISLSSRNSVLINRWNFRQKYRKIT